MATSASQTDEKSLLPNDLAASNSILKSVVNVVEPFTHLNESIPIQVKKQSPIFSQYPPTSFMYLYDNIFSEFSNTNMVDCMSA